MNAIVTLALAREGKYAASARKRARALGYGCDEADRLAGQVVYAIRYTGESLERAIDRLIVQPARAPRSPDPPERPAA